MEPAWHALNAKILMLNTVEKGRIKTGKSEGNSFRGNIMRIVVQSTDFESKVSCSIVE